MDELTNIEKYLYQMGHTQQSVKSYIYGIKNFIDTNPDAKDYRYKDVLVYISDKVKNIKKTDINTVILSSIKKYYDYLIETGYRNDHPCKSFVLQKRKTKEIIHQDLFSSNELELLMDREERYALLRIKNKLLVSLLIYQGLTAGELIKLRLNDVDMDSGSIYIKASKKSASRHLDIIPKQYKLMDNYINECRKELISTDTDILLLGKTGKPITIDDVNYIIYTFKSLFPDRNLNPMTIRMSVISNWLNEKHISMEQVQMMAGHKWISTTERYRYAPIKEQRELINKFHPLN